MSDPETEIRKSWTKDGVPQERQDQMLAEIKAKAQPGAMVGPFKIAEKTQKTCACCGGDAGRWVQHSNQDDGFGICRGCIDWQLGRNSSPEDIVRNHGRPGWNYAPEELRTELTEAGEQTVIPGCEIDAPQTGVRQKSLF